MLRARVGRGDAAQNQLPALQIQVTAHRTRFGLLVATFALAALPAGAAAAPYVPPGNSAATQYTEAVPTAGGPKATGHKQGKVKSPNKVLGTRNTEKLNAQGPQGHAAAELAAATAPATIPTPLAESAGTPNPGDSSQAGGQGPQSAKPGDGVADGEASRHAAAQTTKPQAQSPSGSSGLGEVIGQATGSSSGQLGLLLPLLIVAVVIWSVAYLLRQRRDRPAA
jgi:hypothetical protein